jgi:hypothetical protein
MVPLLSALGLAPRTISEKIELQRNLGTQDHSPE